jgi:hypothetical protein
MRKKSRKDKRKEKARQKPYMFFAADGLCFMVLCSWVQTDMGNAGAKAFGLEEAPLSVDESVHGIVHVVSQVLRTPGCVWYWLSLSLSLGKERRTPKERKGHGNGWLAD